MNPILLRTIAATIIAVTGGILGVTGGRYATRHLSLLVFTAAGALLAVTLFDILPDAKSLLSWSHFGLAVLSGFGLFWLVSRYVFQICPACSLSELGTLDRENFRKTLPLILIALVLHCTMDGLAVSIGDEVPRHTNWAVLLGISFHKFPEGLALSLLLLSGGLSPAAALLWTCGMEATTVLGGVLGISCSHLFSQTLLGLIFAHIAGGFIYLIGSTLQSAFHGAGNRSAARPLILSTGLTFMTTAALLWAIHFAI